MVSEKSKPESDKLQLLWPYLPLKSTSAMSLSAGFQWDYVFDWTILKYQQTKNHAVPRPEAAPAAQADPADTDKGDRSGFARASRGDSGRRSVLVASVMCKTIT